LERAIEDYSAAIELQPDHFKAWYNRGFCLDQLGRHEEAIEDYTKAIELRPNNPSAYHNRGSAYDKIKRHREALEDFNRVVEMQQQNQFMQKQQLLGVYSNGNRPPSTSSLSSRPSSVSSDASILMRFRFSCYFDKIDSFFLSFYLSCF